MTEQLYLIDDAVSTFEATVERTLDDRIVLDRTHFYPTGGGQPHDTGTLRIAEGPDGGDARRWRVVDVEKSDTVYHTLEPATGGAERLPEPGTSVVGEIDRERRRAHSRYHTAQHLLSALLLEAFDARTTGNQLYADHAHLDAAYDRFDDEELALIERRLNELVDDARPVESYTMDRETAEATLDTDRTRIDLLPTSITELRIVEIGDEADGDEADDDEADGDETGGNEADGDETGGDKTDGGGAPYDRTACAGTHVKNTSEIGEIVVTGRETKGSDEERVNFVLADHASTTEAEGERRSTDSL
ncbi:alanine--tRNA ligase-related protein [Halorubrum sp. DTA98]|uniref:alanine--tRNA ligase-related protein n=1 Tax=Halorubrum sp. DTA98 TaxID=3402163 RepID=UPI003AAC0C07